MDLDNMKLPKTNERKKQSKDHQASLKIKLLETIKKFQKKTGYHFEPYEVDNIFLEIIKRNHESYLNKKFGYDTIK